MTRCVEKRQAATALGYQPLLDAATRTAGASARRPERMRDTTNLPMGTDGDALIPLLGEGRKLFARERKDSASWILLTYIATLVFATTAMATLLVRDGYGGEVPLVATGALALIALAAERQSVRVASTLEMSVAALPMLFAAVAFGPLAAMIVGAVALLGDFSRPFARWVTWTAIRCFIGGLAGITAIYIGRDDSFTALLTVVAAAALVEAVGDIVLNAATMAIRRTSSFMEAAQTMGRMSFSTVPLYAPVLAVLVYAYEEVSPWAVVLFFAPALAAQRLFLLYQDQRDLTFELVDANAKLESANLSFASALVATLDARDRYTAGHSGAVANYAKDIAARMGLSVEDQELVYLCGLVHDIGKIGLAAGLLEKKGPLSLDERRQMERHAEIGERILEKVDDYGEIARIVRHHHERIDGLGYPDRLRGEQIPLLSRIIAVADAYDAMTSDRPYRSAMPSRVARLRLAQAVESQFDTTVVAAFEAILAGAATDYREGRLGEAAVSSAVSLAV